MTQRRRLMLGMPIAAAIALAVLASSPLPASALAARGAATIQVPASETVTDTFMASGNEVVLDGTFQADAFATAGSVTFAGTAEHNLVVMGGRVVVTGTVKGALVVAGGTVELAQGARVEGNTYLAGGQVTVADEAVGDTFIAGGQVTLEKSGQIDRTLSMAAGNMLIGGRVDGDLLAYGARLVISGAVGGDVHAIVDGLTIPPTGSVAGAVRYESRKQADIASGSVKGPVTRIEPAEPAQQSPYAAVIGALITWLQGLVGLLLFGITAMLVAPGLVTRSERRIQTEPWRTVGTGVVASFATPVAGGLMLFLGWFIGGWWIGALLLGGLAFCLVLGYVVSAAFVARFLLERTGAEHNHPLLTMALGVVLVDFVSSIPYVGWFVAAVAAVVGLGAVLRCLLAGRTTLSQARAEEEAGMDADRTAKVAEVAAAPVVSDGERS